MPPRKRRSVSKCPNCGMFAKSLSDCNNCNPTQHVSSQRSENEPISASTVNSTSRLQQNPPSAQYFPNITETCNVPSTQAIPCILNLKFPSLTELGHRPLHQDECHKCRRVGCGPLQVLSVNFTVKRRLGAKLQSEGNVRVCDLCHRFISRDPTSDRWENGWPAALLTCLTTDERPRMGNHFWFFLPQSLQLFWQHLITSPITTYISTSTFNDVTGTVDQLEETKKRNIGDEIEDFYNKTAFPDVRCPFGCTTFKDLEYNGHISMQHFINGVFPSFTFFNADFRQYLSGVRPDWLDEENHNGFVIKPSLYLSRHHGLLVVTCKDHNGGSHLQYVHPPKNPATGIFPPKHPDRLAPAVVQSNVARPLKANYSVHTYSIVAENIGYTGASSQRIGLKRKWDVNAEDTMPSAEALSANNRCDVKQLLDDLVATGEISQTIKENILSNPCPSDAEVQEALNSSTNIPLKVAMKMKRQIENHPNNKLYHAFFAQTRTDHGCQPPSVPTNLESSLWFILSCMAINSDFCTLVNDNAVSGNVISEHVSKLAANCFNSNPTTRHSQRTKSEQFLLEFLLTSQGANIEERATKWFQTITPDVHMVDVSSRNDVGIAIQQDASAIVFKCRSRSEISAELLPNEIVFGDSTYELRMLTFLSDTSPSIYTRHGYKNWGWWRYDYTKKRPTIQDFDSDFFKAHQRWNFCLYINVTKTSDWSFRAEYLQFLGGQSTIVCNEHKSFLTKNPRKTDYKCSGKNCQRVGKFRCASDGCSVSICKKHFECISLSNCSMVHLNPDHDRNDLSLFEREPLEDIIDIQSQSQNNNHQTICDKEDADCDSDELLENMEEIEHLETTSEHSGTEDDIWDFHVENDAMEQFPRTVLEIDDFHDDQEFSDSSSIPIFDINSNNKSIPSHLLLNTDCHLLRRTRHPIRGTEHSRRMLQNIVASSKGYSVPLLYPEAMLFSTIFYKSEEDGSYPGSLCSSLFSEDQNKKFGFASVVDHMTTRLKNCSLLCSTDDNYIQWLFDVVYNYYLANVHSSLIVDRGLEEIPKKDKCKTAGESVLKFDEADSRRNVNQLSAMIANKAPTYFTTHTCNMDEHFGVTPIFKALKARHVNSTHERWKAAVKAEMVILTRAWERASKALMRYIEHSPEQPLGQVTQLWYRYEFQTTAGNLPHIHAVIWTDENNHEFAVQRRIVCSGKAIRNEIQNLQQFSKPLPQNEKDRIFKLAIAIQSHDCSKANFRCHKKTRDDGTLICRVPIYPASHIYSYMPIRAPQSKEALLLMQQLDLAYPRVGVDDDYDVCSSLKGGKFMYPADIGEHLSPLNICLFRLTKSSMNVQVSDRYLCARYIAKYAAGIEERATSKIVSANTNDSLAVNVQRIHNKKISGVTVGLNNSKERKQRHVEAQNICLTESIWFVLNFPYVYCSKEFVRCSTLPRENRGGIVKRREKEGPGFETNELSSFANSIPGNFTDSQKLLILDLTTSKFHADKISVFGIRPPELLVIDSPLEYFKFFYRSPKKSNTTRGWIDGLKRSVYLRSQCAGEFVKYCNSRLSTVVETHKLIQLKQIAQNYLDHQINDGYVIENVKSVEIVTSNVLPLNPLKFCVHILFTLGRFTTEYDLFTQPTLKKSFEVARLISDASNVSVNEVNAITRDYALRFLMFLPGATRSFDKYLLSAHKILTNLLIENDLYLNNAPTVLERDIVDAFNEEVALHLVDKKEKLVNALFLQTAIVDNFPNVIDLVCCSKNNPIIWSPQVSHKAGQTRTSYQKQVETLQVVINELNEFACGSNTFVRHQLVVGRPGSGKTSVLLVALAFALSKGLVCATTCLSGERAQSLGGDHLHYLACFPVLKHLNVNVLIEKSINGLLHNRNRLCFLEQLDVLLFDEFGMLNAELWTAFDKVMQWVKGNSLPFGGIFCLLSGDPKQLPPPEGTSIWITTSMLTDYKFYYFAEYVRASPGPLQQLLEILDKTELDDDEVATLCELIKNNCSFSEDWDDSVSNTDIKIVSTRFAENSALIRHLAEVSTSDTPFVKMSARDEESISGSSVWKPTNKQASGQLSYKCLEPEELVLYNGAMLRVTANIKSISVAQGTLAVLLDLPSPSAASFTVWVAPPGVRDIPTLKTRSTFEGNGWRAVVITRQTGNVISFQNVSIRRTQFPLKNYVSSTIHKAIGCTLTSIQTKVSPTDRKYSIWHREQLLVLLSRVPNLNNITFVGSKDDVMQTIKLAVRRSSHQTSYVDSFLKMLISEESPTRVQYINCETLQFKPFYRSLPTSKFGYVYILVSCPYPSLVYVGETICLSRRLYEHNTGRGASFTEPIQRRPWGVLAYITGFDTANMSENERQRRQLEQQIHSDVAYFARINRRSPSPEDILSIARQSIHNAFPNNIHLTLRIVVVGELTKADTPIAGALGERSETGAPVMH